MKMELMLPSPAGDFNFDSACTSPYVTAPSSPRRINNNNFFFSAPTSPTRISSFYNDFNNFSGDMDAGKSTIPFEWEETPGTPKSTGDGDFEFDFSGQLERASLSAADELFYGGKIKPLKLKPPPGMNLIEPRSDSERLTVLRDGSSLEKSSPGVFRHGSLSPKQRKRNEIEPRSDSLNSTVLRDGLSPDYVFRDGFPPGSSSPVWSPAGRGIFRDGLLSPKQRKKKNETEPRSDSPNSRVLRDGLSPDYVFRDGFSPNSSSPVRSPAGRGIFRDGLLSPKQRKNEIDPFEAAIERTRNQNPTERGRERAIDSSISGRRKKTRSLSPFRVADIFDKIEPNQQIPGSTKPTQTSSYSMFFFAKKWKLKDLLLFRSASEGRKESLKKYYSSLRKNSGSVENSSFRSTESAGSVSKRRGPAVSAHEMHYTANRAVSEEMRKKTFLPYKHGLFGCLRFNPAVHELSKGLGSLTRG